MKFAEAIEVEKQASQAGNMIQMPLGLLGFEGIKKYVLLANPADAPFLWLQVASDENLAFLLVTPFEVLPTYQPNISQDDVEFLGLKEPRDAIIFNIVTVRGPGQATVNLKGPLVINRHTLIAKQVVITNAAEYSVQHLLPTAS
jgi:flagellar assembly factor FliW